MYMMSRLWSHLVLALSPVPTSHFGVSYGLATRSPRGRMTPGLCSNSNFYRDSISETPVTLYVSLLCGTSGDSFVKHSPCGGLYRNGQSSHGSHSGNHFTV